MFDRNALCFCGSGKKFKKCHLPMVEMLIKMEDEGYEVPSIDLIKTNKEIEKIKESGKLNTLVLDEVEKIIRPGISTEEINELVNKVTSDGGGVPAPLNYEGYPKSVCTSINDVICHGIPSEKEILKEGDIINVDVSTILDGYFSDASRMFMIGEVPENARKLVEATRKSVDIGLEKAMPYNTIGDIGQAIKDYLYPLGYKIVTDIGGHGVGLEFHEEPFVSHVGNSGERMVLAPGMTFTIEPMVNEGTEKYTVDKKDGWTVRTKDHLLSAQVEYMVLITDNGHEIITR